MRLIAQLFGIIILLPVVAMGTLRYKYINADGPSILFPGGELISGPIYSGPKPDWSFTESIQTIELQLNDPMSSRFVWAVPVNGRLFVVSDYMDSVLGRTWKHWAIDALEGDGSAVVRINGIRYQCRLIRSFHGETLDGVARMLSKKYDSPTTRISIEIGNTWVFEIVPRV